MFFQPAISFDAGNNAESSASFRCYAANVLTSRALLARNKPKNTVYIIAPNEF